MRRYLPFCLLALSCAAPKENTQANENAATEAADLADAKMSVDLLKGHCSSCHGINRDQVQKWGAAMHTLDGQCLEDGNRDPNAPAAGLAAKDRIDCMRKTSFDASTPFTPKRLGLYAAGTQTLKPLFDEAFPGSTTEFADFKRKVAMPRSGTALNDAEFGKLKDWVSRGMPKLYEAFGETTPARCTTSVTPELKAHIAKMKTEGWGARLADQSTPMLGCTGSDPLACLGDRPDVTPAVAASGTTQKVRQLFKQGLSSHYWVRSSADGRYSGFGMNESAMVVDLQTQKQIQVAASYDPYFLPSNDGFAFAGSQRNGGIVMCRQSLLSDAASAASPSISLSESKCAEIGTDVYMSIGTALDGDRYVMSYGEHENDDGGNEITSPLPGAFGDTAQFTFTPMVSNGLSYQAQPQINVTLPREGDMMLSASSKLAATRFGDGESQSGYHVRFVNVGQNDVQTPLAAEVCITGQKANFSFDERFLVTHKYGDNFANIVIVDLLTGHETTLTSSARGVFALYPHFRADGWLYFLIRDMNQNVETVVATDAAIRM